METGSKAECRVRQGLGIALSQVVPAVLASGLARSFCTIQAPDGLLVDAGQPSGTFVDVAGLVGIKCMNAPHRDAGISAEEKKTDSDIQTFSPRHVWLAGYFPQLEDGVQFGWRAVIDGDIYDLLGCEADSQGYTTRISVTQEGL